jgi:hypothetical protein
MYLVSLIHYGAKMAGGPWSAPVGHFLTLNIHTGRAPIHAARLFRNRDKLLRDKEMGERATIAEVLHLPRLAIT